MYNGQLLQLLRALSSGFIVPFVLVKHWVSAICLARFGFEVGVLLLLTLLLIFVLLAVFLELG